MKSIYILILFVSIIITSCEEKDCCFGENQEYFIFGHFYGECGGEGCVEIFKIQDGRLYEDSNDTYPYNASPYNGQWNQLSNEKYEAVKDIQYEVPGELFELPTHILGIPDGGDWGGILIQINDVSGQNPSHTGTWLLDQNENNMDSIYNAFVDKVNEKIALINQ